MLKAMTESEINRVLEEAESLLGTYNRVLVYFKYNANNDIIDTLVDSSRNECAEQNGYYLEYVFKA